MSSGVLVLAATPIGDADDASPRLLRLLGSADVVAAEDTRRLRRLCSTLGVTPSGRVVAHHEHNEATSAPELVALARGGATVLLVTDAGMPAVSDPGFRLVRAAVEGGVRVTTLPGPSAALAALALSGLPTDRFCFEGFVARRDGARERALADLASERRTMVFFEAPHRLAALLAAMVTAFGAQRPAAVCRELTKTYEEVRRGPLSDLRDWAAGGEVRGEVTVVVGGSVAAAVDTADLVPQVMAAVAAGARLKDACKTVAEVHRVPTRDVYAAAVAVR